jgi:WD40 repeat protein
LAAGAGTENRAGDGKVWDALTGREMFVLHGHKFTISGFAFSPDSRRLVTGSLDGTLKLWDMTTGQEILTLSSHAGGVYDVTFSPDSQRIAAAGDDGLVRIWDAPRQSDPKTPVSAAAALR